MSQSFCQAVDNCRCRELSRAAVAADAQQLTDGGQASVAASSVEPGLPLLPMRPDRTQSIKLLFRRLYKHSTMIATRRRRNNSRLGLSFIRPAVTAPHRRGWSGLGIDNRCLSLCRRRSLIYKRRRRRLSLRAVRARCAARAGPDHHRRRC